MSMGTFGVQVLEVALEVRALGKAIGTASQWLSVCPRLTWGGHRLFWIAYSARGTPVGRWKRLCVP